MVIAAIVDGVTASTLHSVASQNAAIGHVDSHRPARRLRAVDSCVPPAIGTAEIG